MRESYRKLAEAYGWRFVRENKSTVCDSYMCYDYRINYYFTTGTLTRQAWNSKVITIRDSKLEDLENLLIQSEKEHGQ